MVEKIKVRLLILSMIVCALLIVVMAGSTEAKISPEIMEKTWERLSETTGFKSSLHLDDSDETNAYITIEDGEYKIVVYQGLLDVLETEDEMAGIIGHEMGHGMHGHLESSMKRNAGIGILSIVLSEWLDSDAVDVVLELGSDLAIQGYSREQEVEADDAGVEFAYKAGYSAWSLHNAIKRMADNGMVTSPSGFNSHPPTERRMFRLAAQAERWESSDLKPKGKSKSPQPEISLPKSIPVEGFDPNGSDQVKVISTYPIDNGLKNVLGIIQREGYGKYSSGKYKEATASFARGVDSYDGNYLAAFWAARSAYKAGHKAEAKRWIDRTLSINKRYRLAQEFRDKFLR